MTKSNKTYKSDVFEAIHETANDLFEAGIITKQTMRQFDKSCLTEIHEFTPQAIIALRERERVSQPIFAHCLNLSKDIISQWERGIKKPSGASLKLLALIEKKGLDAIL
ncbi:transcriptional regulator [Legionella sp. MW5194]|uniref:helix-turn-helix domain-containing protein n=1 Tax=Legionella sp. MW5194 TaxID=2662448 RepID=UPI00193D5295|nr:DNA-binding transcriptional regulator [Legionella sp. MW5194]QRN02962.1 transcriptional regulator [Legionella sp. MW5194]